MAGQPSAAPTPGSGTFGSLKRGWKILLGLAAAIGTLFGAGKAISGTWTWWQEQQAPRSAFDRTPHLGLEFLQGDRADAMFYRDPDQRVVRVEMGPASFVMRMPRLDPNTAVEVVAWTDETIFGLEPGMLADDVTYLQQGRGLADAEYGSGTLFVTNEARNYLIGNRLRPQADTSQVFVSRLATRGAAEEVLTERREPLFLVVYVDRNHDRRIDLGEYEQLELGF